MTRHNEIRDAIAYEANTRGLKALVEHRVVARSYRDSRDGVIDVLINAPDDSALEVVEVKSTLERPHHWRDAFKQLRGYQNLLGTQYSFCAVSDEVSLEAWDYFWARGFWALTPEDYSERLHRLVYYSAARIAS